MTDASGNAPADAPRYEPTDWSGREPTDAPPKQPFPRWLKWFIGIGAFAAAVGLAGSLIRLPYYSFSPGAALDLSSRVHVDGAKTYPDRGDVMLLFVREKARVNVWSWLQASLDSNIDLEKQENVTGGFTQKHANEQAVCDMAQSKNAARVAALRELGYKVKALPGVDVVGFPRGSKTVKATTGTTTQSVIFPAEDALFPCDRIAEVDGHKIVHPEDVSKLIAKHRPGTKATLRIVRAGQALSVNVPVTEYEGRRIIGISAGPRFDTPLDITIDTNDISGPSAGLAMTLAIVDDLTPGDLTGGKKIAVTGTIDADGTVGQIGAIQQKAITAKAAHAQIFIVPACGDDRVCSADLRHLKERVGKSIDVEPVATLGEALRVLRDAGGAPVHAASTS
jgi:PDZ domain-containing protein